MNIKGLNVLQRLAEVKKVVSYVKKDKEVSGYMAVTHDQVTAFTREALNDAGVIVIPSEETSQTVVTTMATAKGVPYVRFEATYVVSFVNIDDPKDLVSVRVTAHALDQGDKAPGKAYSYATKYAILKVLSLETGEGDEGRVEPTQKTVSDAQLIEYKKQIAAAKTKDAISVIWKEAVAECNAIGDKGAYDIIKAEVVRCGGLLDQAGAK